MSSPCKTSQKGSNRAMTLGLRARRVVFGLVLVAMCIACAYYLRTTVTPTALLGFLPEEVIEEEERELLRDLRTSFVPRDARYADVADYPGLQEPRTSRKVKRDRQGAQISNDKNSEVPHPSMGKNGGAMSGRGPLNVEVDLRSMPEIEEAEIPSDLIVNSETLDSEPSGSRALWTDQGDAQKIRKTQADIMKQYMDWTADPCDDFYQYSCGNWAQVNPIPPDKAGFDTFEMLRENIDTVLREILTLKNNKCCNEYPGPNLDLENDIVFYPTSTTEFPTALIRSSPESTDNEDLVEFDRSVLSSPNILNDVYQTTFATNIIIDKERNKRSTSDIKDPTLHEFINDNRMHPVKVEKDLEQDKYDIIGDRTTQQSVNNLNITESDEDLPKALEMSVPNIKEHHSPKNHDVRRHFKRSIPLNKEDDIEKEAKRKEEDPADADAEMKVRYLFESCMNHDILRKRGHQPLLDLLGMFGGWPMLDPDWDASNFDWLEIMAKLRLYNNDILISEWVGPDIMNSDEFVIQLDQTSLGLPTRDYFLQNSNKAYLDGYKRYILKVATLLGSSSENAEQGAKEIILFETRLAGIVSSPEERRNVSLLYQRVSVRTLSSLVPQICWQKYLSIVLNRPTELNETVVIFALKYVQNLVTLISETEPKIIANYLLWRFIRHRVNNLDDRFQEAKQQFYYVLYGREQAPLRWKNCVSQVNTNMGMAMGSMFVQKYFDENSKNDTLTMTREIQESFMEMLNLTTWIDDETKSLAIEKVETMMLRIGYPDFILDKTELNDRYKELKIHPNKYFENTLNILQYLNKIEQSRLGQPVNKTLWNTAPAVVNAYYSRNKNQIMFPAGILQPPFYHRHFPKSLNYGGIGVVIGHEITHGFDDKGRLFDNNGNLHKWWNSLAIEAFHERAQCLIDQYSNYTVSEVSMEIDGFNTQGENIADNGGIKQAFTAYHRWQAENQNDDEILPGLNLTSTQLFFLNFAQVWCGAMRPEALKNKLKTTVHSPGKFRVIGTLSNFDEFAKEFNCPAGSRMNPDTKCRVW